VSLAQFDDQIRIARLQSRKNLRQQIGRERRNDAEFQPAREDTAAVAGEINKVACRREHPFAPSRHLDTDFGERHLPRTALDKLDIELLFEVTNLHRQRGLGHRTGFGGAAEMLMLR